MFWSVELHIGHIIEGWASTSKKSCLGACPIYYTVRNFSKHVFWAPLIIGFFQKFLEILSSISLSAIIFLYLRSLWEECISFRFFNV